MTRDLATLIGPDQPWLTTERFLNTVAEALSAKLRA